MKWTDGQPADPRASAPWRTKAWAGVVYCCRQPTLIVFVAAALWFLPALWWGLPPGSTPLDLARPWGTDELGPKGAVNAALKLFHFQASVSPQYPLAHYFVMSLFVLPYYSAVKLAGMLGLMPHFVAPVMMILHRLPSLLMAAGTVTVAAAIGKRIGGKLGAWVAAAAVATAGPVVYYARTSNVDAPALFWIALGILFALSSVRDGLTMSRAITLGLCAAIATATKDAAYALFLGIGLVVATTHGLDRLRSGKWPGFWLAPAAGLAVAGATYAALSGLVLMPKWFLFHVQFITGSEYRSKSEEALSNLGFFFTYPATLAGYSQLAWASVQLIVAAVGVPVLLLSIVGLIYAARSDRRLFALLVVPVLCLALGVIAPVRFVLPRFLLPIELTVCLLAGVAMGATKTGSLPRAVMIILAAGGIAFSGLRAADLTYQMLNDSRYETGNWLARNLKPGDVVGYYGGLRKLPHLPPGVVAKEASSFTFPESILTTPELIITVPQEMNEPVHERSISEKDFSELLEGKLAYQQVLAVQAPALWSRLLIAPGVNPPVRVFASNRILGRLLDSPRIELPNPH